MMMLIIRRHRPMRNLVLDLEIGSGSLAVLTMSPVLDDHVQMVCGPEVFIREGHISASECQT